MPFFSVIIPVFNVAPFLGECFDSVLTQTWGNLGTRLNAVCEPGLMGGEPLLGETWGSFEQFGEEHRLVMRETKQVAEHVGPF